ncbi:MAG: hypothetical protein R8M45_08010 [Ghiorsea sp.]
MIIRVDKVPFVGGKFDAITLGFVIIISKCAPEHTLPHELIHVRQFWHNPLMPILYLLSKRKRYQYELEAYKESVKHGMPLLEAVYVLTCNYKLNMLAEQILKDLTHD